MSLKYRMILGMLLVVAISGGVSTLIGAYLLWYYLGHEAENRVKQDLNAAREFYNHRLEAMGGVLRYTARGERFSQAVESRDVGYLASRLEAVRKSANLDLLVVTDNAGRVILRSHRGGSTGNSPADDRLIRRVLGGEGVISGTILIPIAALEAEDPSLSGRARIELFDTPKAKPSDLTELPSAMMICAAAPVHRPGGKPVGVLQACVLLNRNYDLVDQVQNTVFRDERYKGKLLGTATIFQDDVRISTNVQREDGSRAIGTRVSIEVYDHVLGEGKTWVGPAWVVNDWYISAYEPIYDLDREAIGMLYVGVLQRKFGDLAVRAFTIFALVAFGGLLVAGIIAWELSNRIARPVSNLASASAAIAGGDFSQEITVESEDEIGSLTRTFNKMARSLRERDELLKEQTRLQLTRSERLASVGRLAAGVAHEINNPLTGVLTFSHMLLRDVPENSQQREDLQTIIDATTRCKEIVRGLLGFSRQSEPQKTLSDLGGVLSEAVNLIQNQALLRRVDISGQIAPDLPQLVIDANQIREVAVNLMLNAIDAMPEGGRLEIRASATRWQDGEWVMFELEDTGCGIQPENLDHIFDPFFTTKAVGEGTGLGLAIAYGVVAEHGGRIDVSSEVSRGTTVTVRLPVTSGE